MRRALRLLGRAVLVLVGLFFVARGVAEVFAVDPARPATYRDDWGGPTYAGVLLVHAGPGLLVLVLAGVWLWRRRLSPRGRAPAPRPRRRGGARR